MNLFHKFKQFLGIPPARESPNISEDNRVWSHAPPEDDDDQFESPRGNFSFNMFTDPLEMHRYFEQQMGEMLRSFGFNEFGDGFSHHFDLPQIQEIPQDDNQGVEDGDLRDHYLKPGFERRGTEAPFKKDSDLDGQLNIKDWSSVFKGNNSGPTHENQVNPRMRFFGQSVSSKTIRNADGSLETHSTKRDNEGNEETTITRQVGDKQYSITKRRDKNGKEETEENLINLDEKDIAKFFPQQKELPQLDQKSWPFFDNFFK